MWRAACVLIVAIACGNKTEPVGPAGSDTTTTPVDRSGSDSATGSDGSGSATGSSGSATGSATYVGPPESGPCNDAHDCMLRDECGCTCNGVLASAPRRVACDKSCPNTKICDGYSLICDLATHRCGAIPKPPK